MSGYNTRVDPFTGRTMKSGLALRPRSELDTMSPNSAIYRAIVLKTYATDASDRKEGRPNTTRLYEIECDILLTRSLVPYPRVPVMQRAHGLNDADLWVPRGSTRVINGQDLNLERVSARGTLQNLPANLEDLDGDKVYVQFVEGDSEKPLIVGAMTHPRTRRLLVEGAGWEEAGAGSERGEPHQNERYVSYRGVEMRINDQGDVLLDTVGATNDEEDEDPAQGRGQVRVRVKGDQRFTVELDGVDILEVYKTALGQPRVDLVEGGTQQFIRGTAFAAALSTFLDGCTTMSTAVALAAAAAEAASVGPLAPFKAVWLSIGNAVALWGGTLALPPGLPIVPGSTVNGVDPTASAVGVLKATLVDGQALSTKIRGD